NPVDQSYGLGIYAKEQANIEVRSSRVDRTHIVGIYVRDSQATIASTLVQDMFAAADGQVGDGISILAFGSVLATASAQASRVARSARAGLSNFSAHVELGNSVLECNAVDIDGETLDGQPPFEFADDTGNICPCADDAEGCLVQSENLAPPAIE